MILIFKNNMASIAENATWKFRAKQTVDHWSLVLQVDNEIEYEILDGIDVTLEEESAINQVFDLYNRIIHTTARIMSRSENAVLDLNPILKREIVRWEKEKEEK